MRFYPPFMLLLFVFSLLALIFFFIMLQLHIITFAFEKLGFSAFAVFLILFGSLIGGLINIPVKELPCDEFHSGPLSFWGIRYHEPFAKPGCTIIAVNVGGALIPWLVSVYLWMNGENLVAPIIATAVVAYIVNRVARPWHCHADFYSAVDRPAGCIYPRTPGGSARRLYRGHNGHAHRR